MKRDPKSQTKKIVNIAEWPAPHNLGAIKNIDMWINEQKTQNYWWKMDLDTIWV